MTDKKSFAEQAVDTRLLVSLLSKAAVGETVSYAAMTEQLSRQMEGADSYLQSALRIVQRDHDIVFSVVRGVGYKRLSDAEIVAVGGTLPGRIRRMARKTVRTLAKARDENLSNAEIVQRNAAVSMAGTLAFIATDKAMRRLETAVQAGGNHELPIGRTLDVFKGAPA